MEERESEYKRLDRIRVKNVLLALLIFLVIAAPAFLYFSISTQAHLALREAKNVKLATNLLAVEFYGTGSKLFDRSSLDGMTDTVRNRLMEVTRGEGTIRLMGYDAGEKEITAFIYEAGHIRVTYKKPVGGSELWTVDYIFRVAQYDSENNNTR